MCKVKVNMIRSILFASALMTGSFVFADSFNGNLNGVWSCDAWGQTEISGSYIYAGGKVVGRLRYIKGFKYPSGVVPVSDDPNGIMVGTSSYAQPTYCHR